MLSRRQRQKLRKEQRVVSLKYSAACARLLADIQGCRQLDLAGTPLTSAKRVEWLFVGLIPDPRKRRNKLRMLFLGRFYAGDDVYLRIIYEFTRTMEKVAGTITKKYNSEIKKNNGTSTE